MRFFLHADGRREGLGVSAPGGTAFVPMIVPGAPRFARLLPVKGWLFYVAAALVLFVAFPVLNLAVPPGNVLHLSDYTISPTTPLP